MYSSTTKYKTQSVPPNTDGAQLKHANNIMERDTEQSHRLHEPTSISSHTDPITGNGVMGTTGHPSIVDGILTVYFESEATHDAYVNTPYNHPVPRLGTGSSPKDDRGG